MEIYTMTKTALAPAFGMPALGSACAAVAPLQGTTVSIERTTGAFPVPDAWRPPIC